MSRTRHKEKRAKCGYGKEYWKSRLNKGGETPGSFTKHLTHKKERKRDKRICEEWVDEY